jgi:competence protein ComEC
VALAFPASIDRLRNIPLFAPFEPIGAPMRKMLLFLAGYLFLSGLAVAEMKIHVIDVGQADSILLEFDSAAILIDAGGEATVSDEYRKHFMSELKGFFTSRPDLKKTLHSIIITHPHIDHTRFLMAIFDEGFTVKNLYDGGETKGSGWPQLKQARVYAKANDINYEPIIDRDIGKEGLTPEHLKNVSANVDIRFLAGSRGCANGNNNSLVLRVHYEDKTLLLTGDSEIDDDEECDEGQVENLLERYEGTDLLRADVYKVGHHGSHNGTDAAFILAVSPAIAILSAGHKETKSPTFFHAFFFGHPREDIVELLEATTRPREPSIKAYTYLRGTRNPNAADTIIDGRLIAKAIYCTCWDGDITVSNSHGSLFVNTAERSPAPSGDERDPMKVEKGQLVSGPFRFGTGLGERSSVVDQQISLKEICVLLAIPLFIYALMRNHERIRARVRKNLATELVNRSRADWTFTRFELLALTRRGVRSRLWPVPRITIDEIIEEAVAKVIEESSVSKPPKSTNEDKERKVLIKTLEGLYSNLDATTELPKPLPSTLFIIAVIPIMIVFFAIRSFPPVGNYLTSAFGHSSIVEELWTGLLASLVGTGATLLNKRASSRQGTVASKRRQESRGQGEEKSSPSSTE